MEATSNGMCDELPLSFGIVFVVKLSETIATYVGSEHQHHMKTDLGTITIHVARQSVLHTNEH